MQKPKPNANPALCLVFRYSNGITHFALHSIKTCAAKQCLVNNKNQTQCQPRITFGFPLFIRHYPLCLTLYSYNNRSVDHTKRSLRRSRRHLGQKIIRWLRQKQHLRSLRSVLKDKVALKMGALSLALFYAIWRYQRRSSRRNNRS